jgi:hypothetical protein
MVVLLMRPQRAPLRHSHRFPCALLKLTALALAIVGRVKKLYANLCQRSLPFDHRLTLWIAFLKLETLYRLG